VQRGGGSSNIDDDDAAVPAVAVLLLVVFLFLWGPVALPAFVAHGDLQPRLFVPSPLLFFAASNLFNDPGFEHDADL
jgi:hypothetical protein